MHSMTEVCLTMHIARTRSTRPAESFLRWKITFRAAMKFPRSWRCRLDLTRYLFGIWRRNPTMVKAAYYNLVAAALTAPVAIATGLTAWQWQLEGAKLKGNLLLHLIFALSASGMIWLLCACRVRQRKFPQPTVGIVYIFLALATVLLIAIAGHLGGIVSGVESGAI